MRPAADRAASPARTEEAGLVALCEQHAAPLLTYVTRLVGDRQTAEDIVQEALLRAWLNPVAVSGQLGSARGWLFTVARNLVMDHFRARKARPHEVSDHLVDLGSAVADEDLDLALQSMVVSDALQSLSPDHRAVLVQTFYWGRSVAQAAAELGIPEGTVKSRAFYGLRALRAALVERGVTL